MPKFDWLRARAVLHTTKERGVLNYSVMTAFTYIILNERSSMEYDAVMYSHCSGMGTFGDILVAITFAPAWGHSHEIQWGDC